MIFLKKKKNLTNYDKSQTFFIIYSLWLVDGVKKFTLKIHINYILHKNEYLHLLNYTKKKLFIL